jgi:hypothetical protein
VVDLQVVSRFFLEIFQCDFSNEFLILTVREQWISPTNSPLEGRPKKMAEPKQQKMVVMASEALGSHNLICESWRKVGGWGSDLGDGHQKVRKTMVKCGVIWGNMVKYGTCLGLSTKNLGMFRLLLCFTSVWRTWWKKSTGFHQLSRFGDEVLGVAVIAHSDTQCRYVQI